jgi:hypothetical protein
VARRKAREQDPRSKRPTPSGLRGVLRGLGPDDERPTSVADLYGEGETGNLLRGRYHTAAVYGWFARRHEKGVRLVDDDGYYRRNDHEWKIPYGLRIALHQPLLPPQYTTQWPFYVLWTSPRTGKRYKKYFGTMPQAIKFVAEKAQYVDENASVVGRHIRDMPPKLRGKFPRQMGGHMHYWCGYCMAPRRFRRRLPEETFSANKKFWSEEKGRYEWKEVKLAVIECKVCRGTNRDERFKRNNQPYEIRRFKQGVRRARRRKK